MCFPDGKAVSIQHVTYGSKSLTYCKWWGRLCYCSKFLWVFLVLFQHIQVVYFAVFGYVITLATEEYPEILDSNMVTQEALFLGLIAELS